MFAHLLMYNNEGKGHEVLVIFSKIAHGGSETIMSILLIIFANGWTVLYQDIETEANIEIYVPVTAIIGIVHVLCCCLTYIDVDASHRYHDFSGSEGYMLLFTKIIIWVYFSYCYSVTLVKIKNDPSK